MLLFLRDKLPDGHVGEFIDRMREARQAVQAAAANEGGATEVAEGLDRLKQLSGADALTIKLMELGLNQTQILSLVKEVVTHAGRLVGPADAAEFRRVLSDQAQIFVRLSKATPPDR